MPDDRGPVERARELRAAQVHPRSYPASAFAAVCLETAREELGGFLFKRLCLDPEIQLNEQTLWYFPRLVETLAELLDLQAAEANSRAPVTGIGAEIHETLDYALDERCLVVVDGVARTGKTFSVKQWCDAHPGQARYVQVPSSNDDMSFFRALCEALGLGTSTHKALELRAKIETVLQTGDLLLVLDEGHYLWPQRNMRRAVPHRINWMRTQLVNMGVPVAVVTTPQFTKSQEAIVRSGGWSSEQLIGRIGLYKRLPDSLTGEDLETVARHWLPSGADKAIRMLVAYAQSSEKYLQGIESLTRRARFVARKAGRSQPSLADVAAALNDGIVPSDNALSDAMHGAKSNPRKVARIATAVAVQAAFRPHARSQSATMQPAFTPPARDTGGAVLSP